MPNNYTVTNYQLQAWAKFLPWCPYHKEVNDFSTFDMFMDKLKSGENFHVARYNDGEWVFMHRIQPHFNRFVAKNGHNLAEIIDISARLSKIYDSYPDYYIGIDSTTRALKGLVTPGKQGVEKRIKLTKNLIYGDVFNAATIKYGIKCFTDPLADRYVITVGPKHMVNLGISDKHVTTPHNNCWRDSEVIESKVQKLLDECLDKNPVILYSCSLLAKLLVDIFYNKYKDDITQMDIGSCIDPWCGIFSRPWHTDIITYYNRYQKGQNGTTYKTESEKMIEGQ